MSDIMETWSRLQAEAREKLPPVLTGRKALIVGVANEHSIAWGCARAMHRAGAEIAMTYLNEKARRFLWLRRWMRDCSCLWRHAIRRRSMRCSIDSARNGAASTSSSTRLRLHRGT